MTEDIIISVPWACGDKDCAQVWHLASYWIYEDGTYGRDSHTDGDHEPVDAEDVPKDAAKAWQGYYRYVVATGLDPLKEFIVPVRTAKERWKFLFRRSILGIVLVARRGGKWYTGGNIPAHVRDYGCANEKGIADFGGWNEFIATLPAGLRQKDSITVTGAYTLTGPPRPLKDVPTYLRREARKALRRTQ